MEEIDEMEDIDVTLVDKDCGFDFSERSEGGCGDGDESKKLRFDSSKRCLCRNKISLKLKSGVLAKMAVLFSGDSVRYSSSSFTSSFVFYIHITFMFLNIYFFCK